MLHKVKAIWHAVSFCIKIWVFFIFLLMSYIATEIHMSIKTSYALSQHGMCECECVCVGGNVHLFCD